MTWDRYFRPALSYPHDTLITGEKGSGKSVLVKTFLENFFTRGDSCVIDLLDMGRLENCYYYFANPYTYLYEIYYGRVKRLHPNYSVKIPIPDAFDTEVFFPAVSGVDEDLPDIFTPFRIPYHDLSFDELNILLGGNLTEVGSNLLNTAWMNLENKPDASLERLTNDVVDYACEGSVRIKGRVVPMANMNIAMPLIRRLISLHRTNLICGRDDEYALDLDRIMRDTSKIHSFTMRYIQEVEYKFLIYAFILKRIYNLRMNRGRYPQLVLGIREAQMLAPARIQFAGQKSSSTYLTTLAAEGRDLNIRGFYDTQAPRRVVKDLRELPQAFHLFRLDKMALMDFTNLFWIPPAVFTATQRYPVGICTTRTSNGIHANVAYAPPRSWVKHPNEDFLEIWRKAGLPTKHFKFDMPPNLIEIEKVDSAEGKKSRDELRLGESHKKVLFKVISKNPQGLDVEELADYVSICSRSTYDYLVELLDAKQIRKEDCKGKHGRRVLYKANVYSPLIE